MAWQIGLMLGLVVGLMLGLVVGLMLGLVVLLLGLLRMSLLRRWRRCCWGHRKDGGMCKTKVRGLAEYRGGIYHSPAECMKLRCEARGGQSLTSLSPAAAP